MKYTAVIVEPRKHKGLHYVLENFMNNLSEEWSFVIFHGLINLEFIKNIIEKHLVEHSHRIKLVKLNFINMKVDDYNKLLKYSKKFYSFIPTEKFLIFKTDSIILKQHKDLINDFLDYDYVGAPWNHSPFSLNLSENERVGNGGLSLRKKSKMIEIMKKQGKSDYPEDIYFSCYKPVKINKPSFKKAMLFSVEGIFNKKSFGCHRPWVNDENKFLYENYDEVKMLYSYNNIPPPSSPPPPPP
jgi:hypothetical protein